MSNLNSSVKFDVLRGWPTGAAVTENFTVDGTAVLAEGTLVEHDLTNGGMQVPAAVATNTQTPASGLYMVISGNDQTDAQVGVAGGQPAGVADLLITVARGKLTVRTEKATAGAQLLGVGDPVSYDGAGLIDVAAANYVIGYVEEAFADGSMVVALSL